MFLGVDIGTSTSKGVLINSEGKRLAETSKSHTTTRPHPGWAEHDPEEIWWEDFKDIFSTLLKQVDNHKPEDLEGIGISGMCSTFVPIGKNGEPLRRAILYGIDRRVKDEMSAIEDKIGEETFRSITGSGLSTHAILPKLMWVRNNEPDIYKDMKFFLSTPGYLVFKLTGVPTMDISTASGGAGLIDPDNNAWAEELLETFSIESSIFPNLGWPTDVAGEVSKRASRETDIPAGVPVIYGTCDAGAEALSAGVTDPGEALLSYGSTMSLLVCSSRPMSMDPFYGGHYVFRDLFKIGCATASAGNLLDWFVQNFQGSKDEINFQELDKQAQEVSPGSGGLLTLPYFDGARGVRNDPNARGAILGLTLDHTKAKVYRSILEGVGFEIKEIIEKIETQLVDIKKIHATGGGTESRVWPQITADITGIEQSLLSSPGAHIGGAMLVAVGVNEEMNNKMINNWIDEKEKIEPRDARTDLYKNFYEQFKASTDQLNNTFHQLTNLSDNV